MKYYPFFIHGNRKFLSIIYSTHISVSQIKLQFNRLTQIHTHIYTYPFRSARDAPNTAQAIDHAIWARVASPTHKPPHEQTIHIRTYSHFAKQSWENDYNLCPTLHVRGLLDDTTRLFLANTHNTRQIYVKSSTRRPL